jgi:phosphoglycolate phosphatase-like HAD superfamily hydrolase
MVMKIIVFDKDGVLIDSVDEIFHESVIAYKEFGKVEFKKINIEKFKKLYPFAKKAEDIYAVMKMIEDKNTRLNRLVKTNEKDAEKFKRKFYNARKYAMKNYYTKWIKTFLFCYRNIN